MNPSSDAPSVIPPRIHLGQPITSPFPAGIRPKPSRLPAGCAWLAEIAFLLIISCAVSLRQPAFLSPSPPLHSHIHASFPSTFVTCSNPHSFAYLFPDSRSIYPPSTSTSSTSCISCIHGNVNNKIITDRDTSRFRYAFYFRHLGRALLGPPTGNGSDLHGLQSYREG